MVSIRTRIKQYLHDVRESVMRCQHQRRLPVRSGCVRIRAFGQQKTDDFGMAVECRIVYCAPSRTICPGARINELTNNTQSTVERGDSNGRITILILFQYVGVIC